LSLKECLAGSNPREFLRVVVTSYKTFRNFLQKS
jgi:hypothetical protein